MDGALNRCAVVTGLGLIGYFGAGVETFWSFVLNSTPTFEPSTRYKLDYPCGAVRDFDLRKYVRNAQALRAPLVSQYALAAAAMAATDAGLAIGKRQPGERAAVVFGTNSGPGSSTQQIHDDIITGGLASVKPRLFQESVFNAPASLVSIHFGIRGPIVVTPMGSATGGFALKMALDLLAQPEVDLVLVLGSDELFQAGHQAMGYLRGLTPNDGREAVVRPFDRRHNGVVVAEGAACLVVERADAAAARGVRIYGEIAGCGTSNDAHRLARNRPDGSGLARSMRLALGRAGVAPEAVDLILSGSGATRPDDQLEANAITAVFGNNGAPPVASLKGALGLTMGVTGLFETVAALKAIATDTLPPTAGVEELAETIHLDVVTEPRTGVPVKAVLCNMISYNGAFSSVLVREWAQ